MNKEGNTEGSQGETYDDPYLAKRNRDATARKVVHFIIGFFSPIIVLWLLLNIHGALALIGFILVIVFTVVFIRDQNRRFIGIGLLVFLLGLILMFLVSGAFMFVFSPF
ncbi:MAG: hypothetical protein HPY50_08275 [Firmicutes bacterium]|nr:hypothetical protein [Bacillota bacterium]